MQVSTTVHSSFRWLRRSPTPRRAAVTVLALAWSSAAFCTEIHDAARDGDLNKVTTLLKDNPDLAFGKDKAGDVPLHLASAYGRKDVVDLLLAGKSDVDARDNMGGTPLHWAANADVAGLLLAHKADVNARNNDGETPLHSASANGHTDVVRLLLTNKADVNAKDNSGLTPLHATAAYGRKDVAELLLANGADVNAKANSGTTPLQLASYGYKDAAELLLANGADANAKDNDGVTPLETAVAKGRRDVAQLLLRQRPTPTHILRAVAHFAGSQSIALIGAIGGTIVLGLLYLLSKSDSRLWRWIQVHVPLVGKIYRWPLVARLLTIVLCGFIVFDAALSTKGYLDVAGLLFADVNASGNNRWTLLHTVAASGDKDMAQLLLDNQADVNAKDKNGWTPLRLAGKVGRKDMAELLRQHGGRE